MNEDEDEETITLTESELELVVSFVGVARELYHVVHGARAHCSTHDEVERKVQRALYKIAARRLAGGKGQE